MFGLQLTPADVLPYIGASPSAVQARTALSARARATMRTQRRCETLPAFRQAVQALVDVAYPAWFADAFFVEAPLSSQLRPCAAAETGPASAATQAAASSA